MRKDEVFAELAKQGAAKAVLHFSGGNDEGGTDCAVLYDAEGKLLKSIDCYDTGLGEALAKPIYDEYHTFAGEFYVTGTLTWDVKAGTSKMDASEEDSDDYSDEDSDEDEDEE